MRNGCRLRTLAIYELEKAGFKVTHTTNPLRFTVEGLAENIDGEQLVDLGEEHGVPLTFPVVLGFDMATVS